MKHRYSAKTKLAILLPIALAIFGTQGCRWDDSMYERYVNEAKNKVSKCSYDLMSLNEGRYIKKDGDKFTCGKYSDLLLKDTSTALDDCTADEIAFATEAMGYGNCPVRAFYCVPRLILEDGEDQKLTHGADMCSDCDKDQINCGDGCVDLMNDRFNCGECGRSCDETETCDYGSCRKYDCPLGQVECRIDGKFRATAFNFSVEIARQAWHLG